MTRLTRRCALTAAGTLTLALTIGSLGAPAATAAQPRLDPARLAEAVTTDAVYTHLRAFSNIAERNGGTRASGTPGYDRSADHVAQVAQRAGLLVTRQTFTFPFFRELAPSTLVRVDPGADTSLASSTIEYSGTGTREAAVTPVDVVLTGTRANTSGCEAADFAGFPSGSIALVQRGTCTFEAKTANAVAAGATAVIIFNQGNTAERSVLLENVTAGRPFTVPVVGTSFSSGVALAEAGSRARVSTTTESRQATTQNVIAETRRGNPDNVVMAGAHLDSVIDGPGINDNGSGSAVLLETARQLAAATKKAGPVNKVRFAWWGAEESGLLGSEYYIDNLPQAGRDKIALYLNFDMVGSPNFARFVYDGDNTLGTGAAGPTGSDVLESAFVNYFSRRGLPTEPTEFNGRSDYGPFIAVGIPSGGLFTGAEGIKTAAQAQRYGGQGGIAYDRCYHQACDTLANVNRTAIDQNADAIAFVVAYFANDTYKVNGVRGDGKGKGKGKDKNGKPRQGVEVDDDDDDDDDDRGKGKGKGKDRGPNHDHDEDDD